MITKTIVKDYAIKKCPFLAKQELDDNTLINLIKQALSKNVDVLDVLEEEGGPIDDASDSIFDVIELLGDRPEIKAIIDTYLKMQPKNPVEELIGEYVDNQLVSMLSRRWFTLKYGESSCARCDVDENGIEITDQKEIVHNTLNYMTDPSIKVIFEGQVEFKDLRARYDILVKNDDGTFDLYEVKGTNNICKHPTSKGETNYDVDNSMKPEYLYDIAFQYYVYSLAGLKFNKLNFIKLNREFSLSSLTYPVSDSDLDKLFVIKGSFNDKMGPIPLKDYLDNQLYVGQMPRTSHPMFYNDSVTDIVEKLRLINEEDATKPKKCYLCKKGPTCPFINECFTDSNDPDSIFKLTNWNLYGGDYRKMIEIMDNDVFNISNIDDSFIDSNFKIYKCNDVDDEIVKYYNVRTQIDYQKGLFNHKYIVSKKLIKDILEKDYLNDSIDYLVFFDFESFQYPIPLVVDSFPWKQVVSQYSMHVVNKNYDLCKHDFKKGVGGGIKHFEYIGNPDIDGFINPSRNLYKTLFDQLKSCGIDPYQSNYKVIVFNNNFEKTRMKDYMEDFNNKEDKSIIDFIENFRNNVVDLLDFFTSGAIYCRDFYGKGSLKIVQPTLTLDIDVLNYYDSLTLGFDFKDSLDYHKSDSYVFNGSICLDLYKALLIRHHLGKECLGPSTISLLDQALAYCKIDSWGTVIIFDIIKNFLLGKIKLDALNR